MIELSTSDVMWLLKGAIADRGADYEYKPVPDHQGGMDCVYVHGTEMVLVDQDYDGDDVVEEQATGDLTPGCIVGHVLINAGVPPLTFVELEINRDTGAGHALSTLAVHKVISASEEAIDLLTSVQDRQDNRLPWGKAVSQALRSNRIADVTAD